jgi:radical SAM superfamily enzyme YgiQ (UPF0313 family)
MLFLINSLYDAAGEYGGIMRGCFGGCSFCSITGNQK